MNRIKPPNPIRMPAGVPSEVHSEIMRRIRNRWHENHDKCSLRKGGPGLPELAGVLPLIKGLPDRAVVKYTDEIKKLRPLYKRCDVCSAKVCALIYLSLYGVDSKRAMPWLIRVHKVQDRLALQEKERDFIRELLEALKVVR